MYKNCFNCFVFVLVLIIVRNLLYKTEKEPFLSPVSNYEPTYEPDLWNNKEDNIKKYNNCYSYMTNQLEKNREKKLHPGELSGKSSTKEDYTCQGMERYILKDFPKAYKISYEKPCDKNYHKGYLTVDPKKDFHFYRQDANGYWSHKPGSGKVSDLDASGNYIYNPEKADRTYKRFDYKDSCMFFCVPQ